MEDNKSFFKSPWLYVGLATVALFALCFWGIDYISRPDLDDTPKVEKEVIATLDSNPELILLARQQGWIKETATEMTSVDASKVTRIDSVFSGCKLETFDEFRFFVGLHEIPAAAFAHADRLRSIVIPAYVEDIKYGAFAYCPSLESVKVDTANTHYDSRQDCNAVICTWKGKLMLVAGCRNTTVPDGVRFLAPQAFAGVHGLKTVAFPERFEEIGEAAFKDCADLETIDIPQGVRFIEPETFAGCAKLHKVSIPKSVERLRQHAFYGCSSLSSMVMPKKYAPILQEPFADERGLTVYVPKGSIPSYRRAQGWSGFKGNFREL